MVRVDHQKLYPVYDNVYDATGSNAVNLFNAVFAHWWAPVKLGGICSCGSAGRQHGVSLWEDFERDKARRVWNPTPTGHLAQLQRDDLLRVHRPDQKHYRGSLWYVRGRPPTDLYSLRRGLLAPFEGESPPGVDQ